MESSFFFQKLGLGAVAYSDIIYEKPFVPRSIKVNLSVPLTETEFQILEVGLRQVGLEKEIQTMIESVKESRNTPEILRKITEFMSSVQDESENEISRRGRFPRAIQRWAGAASIPKRMEASAYVSIDGKTLAYLDLNDAREMRSSVRPSLGESIQMLRDEAMSQDKAFAAMFSFGHQNLGLNSTIVFGYKGDSRSFWPSMAAEFSAQTPNNRIVQRMSSSPAINFNVERSGDKKVKISMNLPKDQLNLFTASSQVTQYDDEGREKQVKPEDEKRKGCTTYLNRMTGVEICSKLALPKSFLTSPIPVMNLEVTLKKTDRFMSAWVYEMEYDNDMIRGAFNTPGSKQDREISFVLKKADRKYQVSIKSPVKQIEASSSYKWSESECELKAEATVDQREKYLLEAGMEQVIGKKSIWKPKLRIEAPAMNEILLGGSVMLDQGRKSQLAFDLHNTQVSLGQKQYIKGSFVKEGQVNGNNDFKLSTDLQADFGSNTLNFRIFGTAEKQEKSLSSDIKIEYQSRNQRKENVKFVGKLQNLSVQSLTKINSFVEVQMTAAPEKNFHVSWNILKKPSEHLENEVTLMWRDQMRDPKRRIHLLQG